MRTPPPPAGANLAANGVDAVVTLLDGDIRTIVTRSASCVLANLTGTLLATASRALARCAEPGGTLVLSGLTRGEEGIVARAFKPIGRIDERLYEGDWAALVVKTRCQENTLPPKSRPRATMSPDLEPS